MKLFYNTIQAMFLVVALSFTTFAQAQCSFTAGNVNPGYTTPASYGANYILGVKYNVPTGGTLTHLNLFGLNTGSGVQMAVYADSSGVPGPLITTSVFDTVVSGVMALAVTPVSLPAGDYWVMAIYDNATGANGHTYYTTSTTQTVYYTAVTYGSPLPASAAGFTSYCCQDFQYWMTFNGPVVNNLTLSECDSYTVPGTFITYTNSGNYADTLFSTTGCDSVIYNLNLTIKNSTSGSETLSSCGAYTWAADNNTYTTSGIYTAILPNAAGCDSTTTLNLTIDQADTSVTANGFTLTAAPGQTYQWIDCNTGTPVAGETNMTFTNTTGGLFAVVVSNGACTDTSACYKISGTGIKEGVANIQGGIYPNPTADEITLKLFNINRGEAWTISVYDITGRAVLQSGFTSTTNEVTEKFSLKSFGAGVYFMVAQSDSDSFTGRIIVR